jgi:hypothetical protein
MIDCIFLQIGAVEIVGSRAEVTGIGMIFKRYGPIENRGNGDVFLTRRSPHLYVP